MSYVDATYYKQTFEGTIIPNEELDKQLQRASDQIDTMTYNRIMSISNLTTFQQERVKKAVCYQADFVYQYGDYLEMPLSGYSVGSTSLSFASKEGAGGVKTSNEVQNLLNATGLTSRRF